MAEESRDYVKIIRLSRSLNCRFQESNEPLSPWAMLKERNIFLATCLRFWSNVVDSTPLISQRRATLRRLLSLGSTDLLRLVFHLNARRITNFTMNTIRNRALWPVFSAIIRDYCRNTRGPDRGLTPSSCLRDDCFVRDVKSIASRRRYAPTHRLGTFLCIV